jgi:hypothetical protein
MFVIGSGTIELFQGIKEVKIEDLWSQSKENVGLDLWIWGFGALHVNANDMRTW